VLLVVVVEVVVPSADSSSSSSGPVGDEGTVREEVCGGSGKGPRGGTSADVVPARGAGVVPEGAETEERVTAGVLAGEGWWAAAAAPAGVGAAACDGVVVG